MAHCHRAPFAFAKTLAVLVKNFKTLLLGKVQPRFIQVLSIEALNYSSPPVSMARLIDAHFWLNCGILRAIHFEFGQNQMWDC